MTRRLLGPIGGPLVFFLVAALVFAGLGWVTHSALRVEQAQREAAARAELGNRLRVALWQLDSRMLPALGVEDSRPYYHYAPPDPAATPLFVANLPSWMKLHFQLDPVSGWTSPLVLDPTTARFVCEAWADVPLRNMSPERLSVLNELKAHYPARRTHDLFAATDRSIPADSLSLAAPLVAGDVQATEPIPAPLPQPLNDSPPKLGPPVPDPTANGVSSRPNFDANSDVVTVLGLKLCLRGDKASEIPSNQQIQLDSTLQQQAIGPGQPSANNPRGMPQSPGGNSRGGRLAQKDARDNEKQVADWMNRAGLIDRAIREAKNAAQYQMPRGQLGNYSQNYLPSIDPRNTGNTLNKIIENKGDGKSSNTASPPGPGSGSGGFPKSLPPQGAIGPIPNPPGLPTTTPRGGALSDDKLKVVKDLPSKLGDQVGKTIELPAAKNKKDENTAAKRNVSNPLDARDKILLTYELSNWFTHADQTRFRRALNEASRLRLEVTGSLTPAREREKKDPGPTVSAAPEAAPRSEAATPPPPLPTPIAAQPIAIHLGSMRRQWVTAPDGSDMLVLVRAAKVDGKTVYQGVVVDWPTLEGELKSVVSELFPEAKLVPVKDASLVYPDRAMTALPVQLDPGPEPELAPAGWTTLRLGLVLAWAAAIIAFAAVGFAGWSLIDLAERRIRFVSAVTHELRTPLTSLRLYLDLLVSGMVQDEQKRREYLGTLAMESDRLYRLMDNVLDFAKLEKRKKNGDIQPVKVGDLLDPLRQTWTDRVAHDGKELIVLSTLPPERLVCTDATMIQQIVGNLIDNARKYTRDAADRRIWVRAKPGVGNGVILEVEDRGAGVPAGERKSIFKPFRRGDQAESKAGGAGLGLALAKSWAEVLGATLTYRPADGGTGACFQLKLPGK